jgi:hypothetical protein
MHDSIFFYSAFLGQVAFISLYYPMRITSQMRYVLANYPADTHPRLYTEPPEYYTQAIRNFQLRNNIIAIIGCGLLAAFVMLPRSGEWDRPIVSAYFLLQCYPLILADVLSFRYLNRMRELNGSTTRHAELQPRRLLDFVSPMLVAGSILTYAGFVVLVVWINQFDYPWFAGYGNIAGITFCYALFFSLGYHHLRGKKLNPHQSTEDRHYQIEWILNVLFVLAIAATLYIAMSITLAALGLRYLESVTVCLYHIVIALVGFRGYMIGPTNFDVYREVPAWPSE